MRTYPGDVSSTPASMKTKETAPQFAEAMGGDDGLDVPSKPIRDPSLDTLLEGLEERLDQQRDAKLRVHTPPSAHTDPFPEEPVVAAHMTAPLSALQAQQRREVADRALAERPTRKHDPTFVLEKPEGPRSVLLAVGALVAVAGAVGVAVWVARSGTDDQELPRAEPVVAAAPLAVTPPAASAAVVPTPGLAPVPVPSASAKGSGPHAKPPQKPGQTSGPGVDHRLD